MASGQSAGAKPASRACAAVCTKLPFDRDSRPKSARRRRVVNRKKGFGSGRDLQRQNVARALQGGLPVAEIKRDSAARHRLGVEVTLALVAAELGKAARL